MYIIIEAKLFWSRPLLLSTWHSPTVSLPARKTKFLIQIFLFYFDGILKLNDHSNARGMLWFTVGSSVREGDPGMMMMMMATFSLSPPVKIRLFLHVHPIVKRLTKTISINRDWEIKNSPNSSTKWTRNNNKWRAIYLLLRVMSFPQMFFYLKSVQIEPVFVEHFVSIGEGGGETKIKEIWPWLLLFVSMDSIDMTWKKRSGWCYFSTTPFVGHQQLKFRNPFFFSIFLLVRTQIQIRRKMNNGSKYYSSLN